MKKNQISKITDDNYSEFTKWIHRAVKVVLYNLDGTQSEVKLQWPKVSNWGEDQEIASSYLSSMVEHWTQRWIQIRAYQVHMGSVSADGTEHYDISYPLVEIPLDRVYNPGSATWDDPKEVLQLNVSARIERKDFKYLKLYDYQHSAPRLTFDEVGSLAFDASLSDKEAHEFQNALFLGREYARSKNRPATDLIFYVKYDTGELKFYTRDK